MIPGPEHVKILEPGNSTNIFGKNILDESTNILRWQRMLLLSRCKELLEGEFAVKREEGLKGCYRPLSQLCPYLNPIIFSSASQLFFSVSCDHYLLFWSFRQAAGLSIGFSALLYFDE